MPPKWRRPRPTATPSDDVGSIVTANQHIYKNMGFDPKTDLMPITMVSSGPQVIVCQSESSGEDVEGIDRTGEGKAGLA